ncbi:MAG: hypothetical protein Q7T50_03190 [Candidatus Magasanikbacteria bacterium]|nr:hypothetical protein [Candidatus Magasanikbacteria bacterium]
MNEKKFLILSGPTGVGESTITKEIIKRYPIFTRLVTATSRKARINEIDKIDYYFFSKEEFEAEIKNGNIPEYQNTRDGSYYGCYQPDLDKKLSSGHNIIANLDIVGAKYFKEKFNSLSIFIMPESMESLRQRHIDRSPDIGESELEARMKYAEYEIKNESAFYDYQVINRYGFLDEAIEEIIKILKNTNFKLE